MKDEDGRLRIHPSSLILHPSASRSAFTLIEMLTTVAVLIILFGLMVSLARYVRARSAEELTKTVLVDLERVMDGYANRNGQLPDVYVFAAEDQPAEEVLQRSARLNNADLIQALRSQVDLSAGPFSDLPISIYDERTLRDAWGNAIVFLPSMHPAVGMAPGDRYFFVSAGPDRQFLTRDDNLYSYETTGAGER